MIRLSVNLNKIALLRNARGGKRPSVLDAATACIAAGCHGITVHPRPDARHITRQDVLDLAAMLPVEFNIEGYPSPEFLKLVRSVKPAQATLVPDPPDALTSSAGWKLTEGGDWLRDVLQSLRGEGIRTSLFMEPEPPQIERARELGADRIELYTGPYAEAFGTAEGESILRAHREAARFARSIGLGINAGHDLDLKNLPAYAKAIRGLQEVSIGHALICDALYMGLTRAVKAYLKALGSTPRTTRTKRSKLKR
ncbi:MAG: pyridoxine 5'-phosphate synthase [Candidatus Binatus sp.]|uniref:pyridoxine 5'-phosphate synthase n=1 Tax=Candidatus Binatus sp. TaxID=2811406 RepID=UPI002715E999|nr:pyridoxine 5'-phosphate synthase [Candidatus Binatus sp.]MDO8434829.1 pyridoxine 5'-phosphate synthase [Candidatus Binatus sp.]